LYDTREQKAALEARNGLLLFEAIEKMVDDSKSGFALTPDTLRELHRIVIQDLYVCAGNFRTQPVYLARDGVVDYTKFQPPPPEQVPGLVAEMCKYVNENFGRSPVHLAAYLMWKHNWIHPFLGGNGRTSRGVSYLVLNVRLGFNLPGVNTIAQQIETDRGPYYAALTESDEASKNGAMDISAMEKLMEQGLAAQLLSVHQKATGKTETIV
jgi:Fic family protein